MKLLTKLLVLTGTTLFAGGVLAAESALKPLMLVPDKAIFTDDFSKPRAELKVKKTDTSEAWIPNQGTRWEVADGVLRGRASSAEYQASHETHKGVHPRIVLSKTPESYVLKFSMRIVDGTPFDADKRRSVPPFVEIGHHIARITWGKAGAMLLADGDTLQLAGDKDFKLVPGKWYDVMVERRADEVVVQFAGGPRFHGKHPSYISDKHAVMLGGLEAGTMEVDNATVWSIKDGVQSGWEKTLANFPAPQDVRIKEPKKPEADPAAANPAPKKKTK
ncbi:MAG TPA: hypothetical protein VK968_19895 [Roseimicrobium sp.]|nr:hypothetical protein [Roseimicrobium sp.]